MEENRNTNEGWGGKRNRGIDEQSDRAFQRIREIEDQRKRGREEQRNGEMEKWRNLEKQRKRGIKE